MIEAGVILLGLGMVVVLVGIIVVLFWSGSATRGGGICCGHSVCWRRSQPMAG
jgi:hypothetical protein